MSKVGFANEEVMEDYLEALLEEPKTDMQGQSVAMLLQQTDLAPIEQKTPIVPPKPAEKVTLVQEIAPQVDKQPSGQKIHAEPAALLSGEFQVLFFDVAGLTLAVPLTHLGGIHQLSKVEPLFGKPDWFMGLMLHRDDKLKVVDSARWVMPEKYTEKLAQSLNYQYLIMLGDSGWGLGCEKLITTSSLDSEHVNWRPGNSKRPWLAGTVKEKMCALINVEQLVTMLGKGLGSRS